MSLACGSRMLAVNLSFIQRHLVPRRSLTMQCWLSTLSALTAYLKGRNGMVRGITMTSGKAMTSHYSTHHHYSNTHTKTRVTARQRKWLTNKERASDSKSTFFTRSYVCKIKIRHHITSAICRDVFEGRCQVICEVRVWKHNITRGKRIASRRTVSWLEAAFMSSFSPDRDLFHLNYASNINQSGNVVLSEVLGIIVPTRPGRIWLSLGGSSLCQESEKLLGKG